MPWNGAAPSKTFGRTDGSRTGATTWSLAEDAGVNIESTDHDTHDQDLAAGINACIEKNGGNTAAANLPMGGFKHTGVANAGNLTDYLRASQIGDGSALWLGDISAADTKTASSIFSTPAAYTDGQLVLGRNVTENTDAVTLNINLIGAKAVVWPGDLALAAADLVADEPLAAVYSSDLDKFVLLNSPSAAVILRLLKTVDGTGTGLDADLVDGTEATAIGAGKHTIFIPAESMTGASTNGATKNTVEIATSLIPLVSMDFATDADDNAGFKMWFPKSFNDSTITAKFQWSTDGSQTAGLDGVKWFIQAGCYASDSQLRAALGTAVGPAAQDHSATADDTMLTAETGAITVANAASDTIAYFNIYRDVSDAGDDLDIDARLEGVRLFFTTDVNTDD